jgi:hypothetical protein
MEKLRVGVPGKPGLEGNKSLGHLAELREMFGGISGPQLLIANDGKALSQCRDQFGLQSLIRHTSEFSGGNGILSSATLVAYEVFRVARLAGFLFPCSAWSWRSASIQSECSFPWTP